jgi:hypothetical protein
MECLSNSLRSLLLFFNSNTHFVDNYSTFSLLYFFSAALGGAMDDR